MAATRAPRKRYPSPDGTVNRRKASTHRLLTPHETSRPAVRQRAERRKGIEGQLENSFLPDLTKAPQHKQYRHRDRPRQCHLRLCSHGLRLSSRREVVAASTPSSPGTKIVTASPMAITDAARILHRIGHTDEFLLVVRHHGTNHDAISGSLGVWRRLRVREMKSPGLSHGNRSLRAG